MKAYAYQVRLYENGQSIGYVLRFPLLSSLIHGIGEIHCADRPEFYKILEEQRKEGVDIVTKRLPLTLRSIENLVTDDDHEGKIIRRIPLDKT